MSTMLTSNNDETVFAAAIKLEKISVKDVLDDKKGDSTTLTPDLSTSESDSEDTETELKHDYELQKMDIVHSEEVGAVEPTTGIVYPASINQYKFVGCGVRTKFYFIHAYTVGMYIDTTMIEPGIDMRTLIMDPKYPKIFRLVMNRTISSGLYKRAIFDAIAPRMGGQDMDKLHEMSRQEMPNYLNKGMEILVFVTGNKLRLQNGDKAGEIKSIVLTRATCENYAGDNRDRPPVSPTAKKAIWSGMEKLLANYSK